MEDLSILLQEIDHRFVQACQWFVLVVAARIVDASTVEDVTAAVAGVVRGDSFFVGETEYFDHQTFAFIRGFGLELRQVGELFEQLGEVWQLVVIIFRQQIFQIGHGEWNALYEVRFLLEEAAESVGTQYLDGAEQNEYGELLSECALVDGDVFPCGGDVGLYDLLPLILGKVSLCLPSERGEVVVNWPSSSSLEINKVRFSILDHHIA